MARIWQSTGWFNFHNGSRQNRLQESRWTIHLEEENLKALAKKEGLWNLFIPLFVTVPENSHHRFSVPETLRDCEPWLLLRKQRPMCRRMVFCSWRRLLKLQSMLTLYFMRLNSAVRGVHLQG
ncbi:unnamed protein product [Urochloa humidicola]